eukprot:TRINITY_DN79_c0_g1_i2.p1 TRINITY_DN79_c0_g1~~TRINITY_DN79_c0_g1_i2.p1  ORF type:complete len:731 (-),score=325.15 TRINITY_DN79_c0_g1_i2:113-2305(-)
MKFSTASACVLALAAANSAEGRTADASGSPVERVVTLLKSIEGKITTDGKAEQQIYDKYACWCETTTARKAAAIEKAQDDLRALSQAMLKFKALVAVRTAEIEELEKNILQNKNEQETATSVREKENTEYTAETDETKQAIAALQQATQVLVAGAAQPSLLQGKSMEQAATSAVNSVLKALPSKHSMKVEKLAFLSEFAAGRGERYAPQSATIQGILKDMYETFTTDLEDAITSEATSNRDFESFMAVKAKELAQLEETKDKKTAEKVEAEANLAEATQSYDDTRAQMKADQEFFDATKEACEAKHAEWTTRVEMRNEELAGIEEALKILTSDEAREIFQKSIQPGQGGNQVSAADVPSLLQVSQKTEAAAVAVAKAYEQIKTLGRQAHSLRLATLAAQVREAKFGHFEKVISAIDKMMQTLKDENQADIAKRDQCKEEYTKTDSKMADLKWLIKKNGAKIDKLQSMIEKHTETKEETIASIKETEAHIEQLKETRNAENQAFLQAKADDESAIKLLEAATAALSKFYKKNGVDIGPIEGSVKFLQQPVFEVSADQAPDAVFSNKGKRKNESKGIVSIMTMITEDLYAEIKKGEEDEAASQVEFEKQLKAAEKLVEDLTIKKDNLETEIARLGEEKASEEETKQSNEGDLKDETDYRAKITPDCDWILGAFKEREQKRAAEMAGLTAAKEHLATSTTEIVQNSLLQQVKPHQQAFDDQAFGKIKFLGVNH